MGWIRYDSDSEVNIEGSMCMPCLVEVIRLVGYVKKSRFVAEPTLFYG